MPATGLTSQQTKGTIMKSESHPQSPSATSPRGCAARWLAPALLAAALLAAPIWGVAGQPTEPLRKLRVESATVAAELQRQGARLVADYGSYQILAAVPATAARLAADASVTPADDLDVIELNSGPLRTTQAEVQALRQAVAPFVGRRLHLVQFAAPVKPEWHAELLASGAQVVAYVPHNAYLIYGDAAALSRVQAWAAAASVVQWEGAFREEYRIHPDARLTDAKGQPRALTDDWFAIQLVADPVANAATLAAIDTLKLAPVVKQEEVLNYVNVLVRLPAAQVAVLAAQPEVVSIWRYVVPKQRDERQGQILAGNLTGNLPSGPGYLPWLASKGFTPGQFAASGFAVDVSDSGLDNGTATPGHFGLYPEGNPALASRVAYNRLVGTPNTGSTIRGCDGHGTLNSHIIAGYNGLTGFPFTDASGYSYGLGIAPFVRVGSSVIFDPNSFTDPNYTTLQSRAYADGARISANSWGANTPGGYNTDAQQYDALVRDAQPSGAAVPAPGNQEMVIVFAAGNAGPGGGTVGSPGTAKNVLTVGAAENVHSHSTANGGNNAAGNDGCDEPDTAADSAADMSDYSSRGPCADGRKKPDLVAPGTHVTGGVSQNPAPGATGSALACFDGSGVCALPGSGTAGSPNNFFPLGQQFYTTSTGTSHATPAAAGAAALVRQWFINHSLTPPSPALTKAWLMNSTRYLTGTYANDTLPSNVQGLGSLNLGTAFDGTARVVLDQLPTDKFTASGQTRILTGTITDASKPFRVTLAWTDAPGSTAGNAYNNNLDLVVTVGGQTYRGNVFTGALSVPGGSADPRNNVESVFLPAGVSGGFIATVTAANIVANGVPNDADPLDQDFALVIYNGQVADAPVITTDGATLTAESCAPGNGGVDPGEFVTLSFQLKNVGTAPTTNLVATLLPGNGVLHPSGAQTYGALAAGGPSVAQPFSFQALGACGSTIYCTFRLEDNGTDMGQVTFPLRLGSSSSAGATFLQPAAITIPASGAGTPYPSSVTVAGVPGTISKVTATVYGFSHSYPADVDFLLVGPTGQNVLLLSSTGGGEDAVGANLTFDDAAATGVTTPVVSGTYKPTSSGTTTLPVPAPGRPYGAALSAFTGSAPNGTWKLYVNDHSSGDSGALSGGWSLTVSTDQASCCFNSGHADLRTTAQVAPNPGAWELDVTYTIQITNAGPATATNVVITDLLPAQVSFASATPSQGTASHAAGVVTASLGDLAAGTAASLQISATVNSGTSLTNRATVSSDTFDFDPANNPIVLVSAVNPPVLNLSNHIYLVAEACANGAVDPGEAVTVSLVLQNVGTRKTTNVVARLQEMGGVTDPPKAKNYGALLPGGPAVTNTFTFIADAPCGSTVLTTFGVTDSGTPLLVATNGFRVGVPVLAFSENFDTVTPPALPAGWTATLSGTGPTWQTTAASVDTPPNAAFVADPGAISDKQLVSPAFLVTASGAQVIFRHSYNTEACCDGGKLELSIGGGVFVELITAGGSFAAGGYGPDGWWAGLSGGFITTIANLPATTLNQSVRLRWHFTSDPTVAGVGWYVDSIAVLVGSACCLSDDLTLGGTVVPSAVMVGEDLTFNLAVTNTGPATATGVTISNFLPAGVSFINATASQGTWSRAGNLLVANLGALGDDAGAGLAITVKATSPGWLTNQSVVHRDGTETYLLNNTVATAARAALPTINYAFRTLATVAIPPFGAGTPYPATLAVSGIAGPVTKVTATLNDLSHTYPGDLDILLVGPGGQKTMLLSDCGGSFGLVSVTLTLDDQASSVLPSFSQITSGAYKPTDYSSGDAMPTPAPAGPYGTSFSVFQDVNPNGTWNLFINDDATGDFGNLAGGWSLNITAMVLPPPLLLHAEMGAADMVHLTFESIADRTYIMEYKDSLDAPVWHDMAPVVGTGSMMTVLDSVAGHTQRVYRLRME